MDLSAFAPDVCEHGHDLRVRRGNRRVLTFPCDCAGIKADPRKRLIHIEVKCAACEAEGRRVSYFDPPHATAVS